MSTLRQRHVHVFVSRRTHPEERCDAAQLLVAGDRLAAECEDAREWLASRAGGPEVQERIEAALAEWEKVTDG